MERNKRKTSVIISTIVRAIVATLALLTLTKGVSQAQHTHHHVKRPHKERPRQIPAQVVSHNDDGDDHHHHDEDSPVHIDLGLGYAYGLNGFIVPQHLKGGLEDGHGAWLHFGLHPAKAEWIEINLGGDFINKGEGNLSWGIHCGVVLLAKLGGWVRLGLGPFLGYHGERRLLTLSLDRLDEPETFHSFIFGVSPVLQVKLGLDRLWFVAEAEIGFTPLNYGHKFWEWETVFMTGLKFELTH